MHKKTSYFHLFLIFVLFSHGAAYFIVGDIYNKENPLKLLKYILSVLYLASLFFYIIYNKKRTHLILVLYLWLSTFVVCFLFVFVNYLPLEFVFFVFIPFLYYFIHVSVSLDSLVKVFVILLLLAFIFMILEFLFFSDISSRFDQSGFRSISIFVNPNAFGTTVVLFFLVVYFRIKSSILIFLLSIVTVSMVLLSGSKTAMGAYFLIVFCVMMRYIWRRKVLIYISLCMAIPVGVFQTINDNSQTATDSLEVRKFDFQSGSERLKEFSQFTNAANECIFVPYHCDATIYLDNAFVFAWISLGFPGLLIIILCFVTSVVFSYFLAIKKNIYFFACFFLIFWLMSMSTNLMNIWPTAYIFWIVYGYMIKYLREPDLHA